MKVTINTLKHEDYRLIPSLYADSFNETPWSTDWYTIDQFDQDANWIASVNGKAVGFLISFISKEIPYISVIGVIQSEQGLGIGRKLIRQSIDYWEEKGYTSVRIHVNKEKHYVKHLYEAMGFNVINEDDEDYEMIRKTQEA